MIKPSIMTFLKIVMVGGGSYNWCPSLLSDLVQTPELKNSEIWLLDPDEKAAAEIKAAIEKADGGDPGYKFIVSSNEDEAFKDADFVVITISTGGLEAMRSDLDIPEKYGILQTVGDSTGPGGWARLLRNIGVIRAMVEKIERLSPNAVILNYTNPMAGLTGLIANVTGLRSVGLCHGLFSTYWAMGRIFDADEKDIRMDFAGVNHFFWVTKLLVRGKDAYSELREKLETSSLDDLLANGSDRVPPHKNMHHLLVEEFFRQYGCLTYFEDRHICEYFPCYLGSRAMIDRFKLERTTIAQRYEKVGKNRDFTLKMISGERGLLKRSRETAIDIICAIAYDKTFSDIMNLPNKGQISNLPLGAVVETMGCIRDGTFEPIAYGALPEVLRQLVEPHCVVQKMTLDAALSGNRKMALDALQIDPASSVLPPSDIRRMGGELLEANKDYIDLR